MPQEQGNEKVMVAEQTNEVRNDPAFAVDSIDSSSGEVILVIQKGILGALANQLKNTSNRRKGSSILRKLGYVLSDCGDILYGKNISETDLNPDLVMDSTDK